MTSLQRRVFMARAVAGTAALVLTCEGARAADASELIDESDPQAVALGYKADTKKVDAKKYSQHAAAQTCGNCTLFVGKASDATGGCAVFPGKKVAGPGWCSAWVKRAGT